MTTIKIILSGLAIATVFSACSSEKKQKTEESTVSVETYSPNALQNEGIFVSGMISSKQTAMLSTRIMGFVEKIYVRQGDLVKKGQLLLLINSDDLKAKKRQAEAMVAEAEAAAKNAKRDYERFKTLHSQRSVSDKELENIELNMTSINAKLEIARQGLNEVNAMLAYTHIKAPFSGYITQKMIDEGSTANPGMPLLSIEQSGDMNIKASVPENYVQYLKIGDSVRIDIKSLNKWIDGSISELSPSATLTGGQYAMKIAIAPKEKRNLRTGMYAGIHIPNKLEKQSNMEIWIEKSSVVKRDQLTGVYIVTPDNQAMLRWIRLGKEDGNQIEVLAGLNVKDRIIRKTDARLYNGKKVTVLK